jgi:hypothetical protein
VVAEFPFGAEYGRVICGDTDYDGSGEIVLARYTDPPHRRRWQILEQRPMNRYEEVYADTGTLRPFPPGIVSGNFTPWDIGDVDEDGLAELLGYHIEGPESTW